MKTKRIIRSFSLALVGLVSQRAISQSSIPNNGGGPGFYLGWNAFANQVLQVRNDANQPIDWFTSAIQRSRLYPTQTSNFNMTYDPAVVQDGFMAISDQPAFFTAAASPGPFSRLHLVDQTGGAATPIFYAPVAPYRGWMRNGISMSGNADFGYIGQRYNGADRTDMVIHWSNDAGTMAFAPDRLRFMFTTLQNGAASGATSFEGLEAARFYPARNSEVYFGVGDFFAGNLVDPANITEPTDRLDVLNGRVRVRDLPLDMPGTETMQKFLVVDDVNPSSPEYGVIKWRNIPASTGGIDCDWGSNSGPRTITTAQAIPGAVASTCPDYRWKVHVGPNAAGNYKFNVRVDQPNCIGCQQSGGMNTELVSDQTYYSVIGSNVDVKSASGSPTSEIRGVMINTLNGSTNNHALYASAVNNGLNAQEVFGGYFNARSYGAAQVNLCYGLRALSQAFGTSPNSHGYGIYATATNAVDSKGVYGNSVGGSSTTNGVGVHGEAGGLATNNYGVRASASAGAMNYGVHGSVSGTGINYAGYFSGNVYCSGMYLPSDAILKSNVAELSSQSAVELLNHIQLHTYRYDVEQFPQMNLPEGDQVGVLAHELEELLPGSITVAVEPAVVNGEGEVVQEAVQFKAVNYTSLIPYLVASYQDEHRNRIALEERLDQLEQLLAECCNRPSTDGLRENTPTGIPILNDAEGDSKLRIQPNPFSESTTVYYTLERGGRAQLMANSADGKQLRVLQEANLESGDYQYNWNTADLAAGMYYVTLLLDGQPVVKKAVKVNR